MNYKKIVVFSLLVFAITSIATNIGDFIFREILAFDNSFIAFTVIFPAAVLVASLIYVGLSIRERKFLQILLVSVILVIFKLPAQWNGFTEDFDFLHRLEIVAYTFSSAVVMAIFCYALVLFIQRYLIFIPRFINLTNR